MVTCASPLANPTAELASPLRVIWAGSLGGGIGFDNRTVPLNFAFSGPIFIAIMAS